jgi:hypothetical protein
MFQSFFVELEFVDPLKTVGLLDFEEYFEKSSSVLSDILHELDFQQKRAISKKR